MDKRWRNIGVLVVIIIVLLALFIIFTGNKNSSNNAVLASDEINFAFEKNNYSKDIFFSETALELNTSKLSKLAKDLEGVQVQESDVNGSALKTYYLLASELKLYEKEIFNDVQKYSIDENLYCENIDEILDIDSNLSTLNSKYEALMQIKSTYLVNTNIGVFDEERFVLAPKLYSEFSETVFTTCVALNVNPEAEE